MSMNLELRERFGRPAQTWGDSPTFSSSEDGAPVLLRRVGPLVRPIDISNRLRKAGVRLSVAHSVLDRLSEGADVVLHVSAVTDIMSPSADLKAMDASLCQRRVVEDAGAFIRDVRSRRNLSQRDFAHMLGLDAGAVAAWEQDSDRPDDATLALVRLFDETPRAVVVQASFEPVE